MLFPCDYSVHSSCVRVNGLAWLIFKGLFQVNISCCIGLDLQVYLCEFVIQALITSVKFQ